MLVSLLLPLSLLAPPPLQAAPEDLDQRLTPALEEVMARFRIPGLAVGIQQGGATIYARGLGTARRGQDRGVNTRSIFHMASVSKPFVATAVMTLVEAGKVDLDDRLVEHLPYFTMADERALEVTIRQVLQHRSGIPDVRDYEWDKPQYDNGAAERYVRSLAGETLLFDPGTRQRYSNMAFDVLGDLIAKVSGTSFDDYLEEAMLIPLGMTTSSFVHDRTPEQHRTWGHSNFYGPRVDQAPAAHYPYNRRHAPSSTLNSSMEDMLAWLNFNLTRGAEQEPPILSDASFDLLFGTAEGVEHGLSWSTSSTANGPAYFHSGGDVGYSSLAFFVPESGLGIVIMGNMDGVPIGDLNILCTEAVAGRPLTLPVAGIGPSFASAFEEGGIEAAIEVYEALRSGPVPYLYGFQQLEDIGRLLLRAERYEDAVAVLDFNLGEYYQETQGLVSLARAMIGTGAREDARALLEEALLMDSDHAQARELLEGLDGA